MESKKQTFPTLIGIMILLSVILIVLLVLFIDQRKKSNAIIARLEEYSALITFQKDSLEVELKNIILQYDSLKSDNDTMNVQLIVQQEKIQKLLELRISDVEKIRRYEKELKSIREVLRSYIVQIDSLNTKNVQLMAENIELKNKGSRLETRTRQLEKEKEILTSITDEAKTLIASGINTVPLNKRGKEDNKIDRITKLRTDFTLRKNTVAEPGPKMIFLRMIRPDGIILSSLEAGLFSTGNEEIPYSAKREINYENNDIPVSIYWDNNGDLIAGNYKVELYCEGKLIGNTEFSLKEGRLF